MRLFGRKKEIHAPALPLLHTDRLVLRCFDPNDAVSVYAYAQSDKVGPMAGFIPHRSIEESRQMIERYIQNGEAWAVVEKSTGVVIGSISLRKDPRRQRENALRIGYALGEAYWGRGYATEAINEVLRYAFGELHCEVMGADHFPINQRSKRVLKKLGFVLEGTIRQARVLPDGRVTDLVVYSLLASEYEALQMSKRTE